MKVYFLVVSHGEPIVTEYHVVKEESNMYAVQRQPGESVEMFDKNKDGLFTSVETVTKRLEEMGSHYDAIAKKCRMLGAQIKAQTQS
jgi:prefoldin subunit 5